MSKLFIDIETNGLPRCRLKEYDSTKNYIYDTSRMIEVAYIIADGDEIQTEYSTLIDNNVEIKNTFIHGISNQEVKKSGIQFGDFLKQLETDIKKHNVTTIISHNIRFDINILLSEIYRYITRIKTRNSQDDETEIYQTIMNMKYECTMFMGMKYLKMYKYPKLEYLYEKLYDDKVIIKHRAYDDARICMLCYNRLNE